MIISCELKIRSQSRTHCSSLMDLFRSLSIFICDGGRMKKLISKYPTKYSNLVYKIKDRPTSTSIFDCSLEQDFFSIKNFNFEIKFSMSFDILSKVSCCLSEISIDSRNASTSPRELKAERRNQ